MCMEPITTVTTVLSLTKSAAELSKKLYDFGKTLKDRDAKQQVDEMLETLRDLKQSAAQLGDQNRELREKLRFKSDEYEFHNPFHYRKDSPDEPLCAKCFANQIEGHMGEMRGGFHHRQCLVCGANVHVENQSLRPY